MITASELKEELDLYEQDLNAYREQLRSIRQRVSSGENEEKACVRNIELMENGVRTTQKSLEILYPDHAEERRRARALVSQPNSMSTTLRNVWIKMLRGVSPTSHGYTYLADS